MGALGGSQGDSFIRRFALGTKSSVKDAIAICQGQPMRWPSTCRNGMSTLVGRGDGCLGGSTHSFGSFAEPLPLGLG